jgi:hypothetical protein
MDEKKIYEVNVSIVVVHNSKRVTGCRSQEQTDEEMPYTKVHRNEVDVYKYTNTGAWQLAIKTSSWIQGRTHNSFVDLSGWHPVLQIKGRGGFRIQVICLSILRVRSRILRRVPGRNSRSRSGCRGNSRGSTRNFRGCGGWAATRVASSASDLRGSRGTCCNSTPDGAPSARTPGRRKISLVAIIQSSIRN